MATAAERAIAARALRDAGQSADAIAELLSVSASQVYRYLEERPEPEPKHSVLEDLEALLAIQDLDEVARVNASVARALAAKLDKARVSTVAQDSMAIPAIAKELRNVLEAIVEISAADRDWVQGLFQ